MTAAAVARRPTRTGAAGAVCCASGLLGAGLSGLLGAVAGPGSEPFGFPRMLPDFTAAQMLLALSRVGLIVGLLALWWSGAVPDTRRGRTGHHSAVALMAGLIVAEGIAISVPGSSAMPPAFGVVYGLYTALLGIALLVVGLELARAGAWPGWHRWLPVVLGLWLFVPVLPVLILGHAAAGWVLGAWFLIFALMGWVLTRSDGLVRPEPPSARRGGRVAGGYAVLTWIYVTAFGSAAIPNAGYVLQNQRLPSFLGVFDMYGGPWTQGVPPGLLALLLIAFFLVTLGAAWAAWLVRQGSRTGGVLGLVLLPLEMAFWAGFALPLPWLIGIVRVVLMTLAWRSLSPRHSIRGLPTDVT